MSNGPSFPVPNTLRPVLGFEVNLPEQWYSMPLDRDHASETWAADLAERLQPDTEAGRWLEKQLGQLQDRLRRMDDPYLTAAVWIPAPESGRASCVLGFEAVALDTVGTAAEFESSLEHDAQVQQPGRRMRNVLTWRSETDIGTLVGANNLIEHRTPGDAEGVLEERTIFGVYPEGATHMIQFIFSTHDLGAFDNMSQQTQDVVQTLSVQLGDA